MNSNFKLGIVIFVSLFLMSCGGGNGGGTNNGGDIENLPPTCIISIPSDGTTHQLDDTIVFTAVGNDPDGEIVSYKWNFGNEITFSGEKVSYQFAEEGTYVVTLTVTDNDGSDNSESISIIIKDGYSASGSVKNRGIGLQNIKIEIKGELLGETLTDENGDFVFSNLEPGEYFITINNKDYHYTPEGIQFEINNQDKEDINFTGVDDWTLYNVNFNGPLNEGGVLPEFSSIKFPRELPLFVKFGNPHVVNSFGIMEDKPCIFGGYEMPWCTTSSYDQLMFNISRHYDIYNMFSIYRLEMELCIENIIEIDGHESFDIFFDIPGAVAISFKPNGIISAKHSEDIGTYEFGEKIEISITLDIYNNNFQVIVNGEKLYDSFIMAPFLKSIRMSMHSSSSKSIAAVDNIRICDISNKSNVEYFLYDGQNYNTIHYPGSEYTVCTGLNDDDAIVGYYLLDGMKKNFLLNQDGYQTIDVDDGFNPELVDINNNNVMVGECDDASSYGFIINEDKSIEKIFYKYMDRYTGDHTFIGGINNSGTIVANNNENKIYIGDKSNCVSTSLGLYNPNNCSTGINIYNHIVGNQVGFVGYLVDDDGYDFNCYIYHGGDFEIISYPQATNTYLTGINDNNIVTGFYIDSLGDSFIFTYNNGNYQIIENPDGYSAFSVGINNAGKILGGAIKSPNIKILGN